MKPKNVKVQEGQLRQAEYDSLSLEKKYCRAVSRGHEWTREARKLAAQLITKWHERWPNACKVCAGHGGSVYYENHGIPGPGEAIFETCGECEGKCPRCGTSLEDDFYEDDKPCPKCGWNWDHGKDDSCPDLIM